MPRDVPAPLPPRVVLRKVAPRGTEQLLVTRSVLSLLNLRHALHPVTPARTPLADQTPQTILVVYSGALTVRDLFVDAGSPATPVNVIALVREGASIGSISHTQPALRTGTAWAVGSNLFLANRGRICGAGGAGGAGHKGLFKGGGSPPRGGGGGGAGIPGGAGGDGPANATDGQPGTEIAGGVGGNPAETGPDGIVPPDRGQPGGPALGLGFALTLDNSLGIIRGGGAGGPGGFAGDGTGSPGGAPGQSTSCRILPVGTFPTNFDRYRSGPGGPLVLPQASPDPVLTILNEEAALGTIVVGGPRRVDILVNNLPGGIAQWFVKDELDFDLARFYADAHREDPTLPKIALVAAGVPVRTSGSVQVTGSRAAGYTVTYTDGVPGDFTVNHAAVAWFATRLGVNPVFLAEQTSLAAGRLGRVVV